MKKYKMPFETWEDGETMRLREGRGDKWANDRLWYCRQHFHGAETGGPYFLNRRCRGLYDKHGPFKGRYKAGEELVGKHEGEIAYIVCPGPTVTEDLLRRIVEKDLTIAVNSGGFAFEPKYWVLAESGYALWLIRNPQIKWNPEITAITTARVAVVLRAKEIGERRKILKDLFVIRWEEEFVVPPRTPAVSIMNALVTAWQMGCSKAYVIGMDLSKEGGAYMKGVPYTKEGEDNPFDDQIRALQQFQLPGFEVFNGSPLSKACLPNFTPIDYEEIQ